MTGSSRHNMTSGSKTAVNTEHAEKIRENMLHVCKDENNSVCVKYTCLWNTCSSQKIIFYFKSWTASCYAADCYETAVCYNGSCCRWQH